MHIKDHIEAALDVTDIADPHILAGKIINDLTEQDIRDALAVTLPSYVREVIRTRRNAHPLPASPTPARSSKVEGISRWWSTQLRDRVQGEHGWKMLGECGYTDLMAAAERLRTQASRNVAKASQYERLATVVQEHGVERVADLDPEVLHAA